MSRSFFAPTSGEASSGNSGNSSVGERAAASPSDSSRAPFLSTKEAATTLNLGTEGAAGPPALDQQEKSALAAAGALPPILAYCTASILMTVVNKVRSHHSISLRCRRGVGIIARTGGSLA